MNLLLLNRKVFGVKSLAIIAFLCISTLYVNKSRAQINVGDSLALVSLYNTTNGPNWNNSTNWLTGPVSTWHGIQTGGTPRVRLIILINNNLSGYLSEDFFGLDSLYQLTLAYNNFTGTIPSSVSSFPKLTNLQLVGNHFTSPLPLSLGSMPNLKSLFINANDFTGEFPDTLLKNIGPGYGYIIDSNHFTDLPYVNTFLGTIRCRNNNLTFEDILPYAQSTTIGEFTYNPQDSIGISMDTTVIVGDTLTLDSWCGGVGNLYRWKQNGSIVTSWDTLSTLVINNIQLNHGGHFSCEVTNPGAPLLTLIRRLIYVQVNIIDGITTIQNSQIPKVSFNPINSFLRIQLQFTDKTHVKSYLYDMLGKKVMTLYDDITLNQDLHYYLSWLPPGIYLVNLQFEGHKYSTKILIR